MKERGATRTGALDFDATVALLFTYEERLRRREDEGDRLALAETAEETARIAVERDREDAAVFLKTAAARFLDLADHPGGDTPGRLWIWRRTPLPAASRDRTIITCTPSTGR
ncbi:hypothetical protein [Streptomyces rapamycinicus]|uniref:hypothetical protein n=1 Tax=Streptomyces rapamycinicus TaxID=1226757 RepID=UPI0020C9D632|nr:hypothetical protein [Streptomyces rapamycinicus]UTP28091.1 hypothetical protein LIV37_01170 [Streptomyces rapamycinicus NRRL 5491]